MLIYLLVRFLTFPLSLLPYASLHALGRHLGTCAYYLLPKFRKRALSNLALAKDLALSNNEIRRIAKECFQGLMITLLEYPKLARETDISRIATCENPEKTDGKGVIFFCGHQANWELLFLEGTSRMPGVAIGRPIKNRYLYNWILQMRQKFGGKIIPPKNALKEGLRALKQGAFLGIVGDQGMPNSGYLSPFLGRQAWTSPLPAILAYRTNSPILVATTRRERGHYFIRYSDPIYPRLDAPAEEEIKRLMDETLTLYQQSIRERPSEWMWIHNRWKQQSLDQIKRAYRHDSIAVILSEDPQLISQIGLFRTLYPTEQLTFFVPSGLQPPPIDAEILSYADLYREDLRFKLLFNFTSDRKIERHFKKLTALKIVRKKAIDATLEKEVSNA